MFAGFLCYIDQAWGTGGSLPMFCTLARERSGVPTLVGAIRRPECSRHVCSYPLIKARATFDEMVKNKGYRAFRMRLAQRSNAAKLVRTILLFYLMDNMSSDIFQTI